MKTGITNLAVLLCVAASAATGSAQDFSALEKLHAASPPPPVERRADGPPRVLIAGDSWAQFMWDDGVHEFALDRFGLGDVTAISRALGSDPGAGYSGPEYAVSGTEARQWADTASYPYLANTIAALEANPTVDHVVLSIGGNDVLAGRSGNGWYKDMDLDVPGSEEAFFQQLRDDSFFLIDALLAVRPDLRVIVSSYDYPNFNVGLWCFLFACPKRNDLSRDPSGDLITDAELNQLMIDVETRRRAWAANDERVLFDNSIGLMHHVYGDGVAGPRTLPRPGVLAPDFEPFPGGNPLRPSRRDNFRLASGFDADPIHLTPAGYAHKAGQQTWAYVLRGVVAEPDVRLPSSGGSADGWTDGVTVSTTGLAVGDDGTQRIASIVRFETGGLAAGAVVTRATLWLTRTGGSGASPFVSGALGAARLDVARGGFGTPAVVEPGDRDAPADVEDVAIAVGAATATGDAVRWDIDPAAFVGSNSEGVELRIGFDAVDANVDRVAFADGDAGDWSPVGVSGFAETLGTAVPVLELDVQSGTDAPSSRVAGLVFHEPRPNPFNPATSLSLSVERRGRVQLTVHDARGRRARTVVDRVLDAGDHTFRFDGRDARGAGLASGVYFARALYERTLTTRRLVLVR